MEKSKSTDFGHADDERKIQKAKAKSQFIQTKYYLMNIIEQDLPSLRVFYDMRQTFVDLQETLMNLLLPLSAEYKKVYDIKNISNTNQKLDIVKKAFEDCQDIVQEYLDALRSELSSVGSIRSAQIRQA